MNKLVGDSTLIQIMLAMLKYKIDADPRTDFLELTVKLLYYGIVKHHQLPSLRPRSEKLMLTLPVLQLKYLQLAMLHKNSWG